VAVVNQAILDVLEHGEESEDAERWLLSKDLTPCKLCFIECCEFMPSFTPVVRQIVVHHSKRISFSLAEVLRFGIAC
jgi:hypothetical protein